MAPRVPPDPELLPQYRDVAPVVLPCRKRSMSRALLTPALPPGNMQTPVGPTASASPDLHEKNRSLRRPCQIPQQARASRIVWGAARLRRRDDHGGWEQRVSLQHEIVLDQHLRGRGL